MRNIIDHVLCFIEQPVLHKCSLIANLDQKSEDCVLSMLPTTQ